MEQLPEDWPLWVVIIFQFLILFRNEIGKFLPSAISDHFRTRADRQADREEHKQAIEEVRLNAHLQAASAEQLRASWREEQWAVIVADQQTFIQNNLLLEIKNLNKQIDRQQQEIRALRRAVLRVGDISAVLFSQGQAIFKTSSEIDELISGSSEEDA